MEKDRSSKVMVIVMLFIAVVGLSVGFAAFARNLNITFSDSNVNVSGDLDIKFLASEDPEDRSTTINATVDGINGAIPGNSATISSDGLTISGMGTTFNNTEQGTFYYFYIYNNSEYDAYLKAVNFLNYTGAETYKVCTALTGTTQSLVDAACENVHVGINIAGEEIYDTSVNSFTSVKIPKGEIISVGMVIAYGDIFGDGTALLPNGDFKINFGEIKFSFSSLEG